MLGSHVGLGGKEQFLGSVKEALSYKAETFMVYTGAPQNTRRKDLSEMRIPEAAALMAENGIRKFVVHAPYIVNLGNTVKPEAFDFAVEFLREELRRTAEMGSDTMVLHPGAHVGEGEDAGIQSIIKGINLILDADTKVHIALETMAGKGSEIGGRFEELRAILDQTAELLGLQGQAPLGVCLDTCHVWDGGYDIAADLDGVLAEFDRVIGLDKLCAVHLNDSKNDCGSRKDRHEKLGRGRIGAEALRAVVRHPLLQGLPFILETPNEDEGYRQEIALVRSWTV